MFSISMRDQGCDVKIIGVKIEETHLVTILAWGEEKKKRVTQIRRWGYSLIRDNLQKLQNIHEIWRWGYILTRNNLHKLRNIHKICKHAN